MSTVTTNTAQASGGRHEAPTPLLELDGVLSGLRPIEVLHGVDLAVAPVPSWRCSPQRRRQDLDTQDLFRDPADHPG